VFLCTGVDIDEILSRVREEIKIIEDQGIDVVDGVSGERMTLGGQLAFFKLDMPAGCEVCGHVGPKGDKLCRSCMASREDAKDPNFDILVHQRQQSQSDAIRAGMQDMKTKTAIKTQTTATGGLLILLVFTTHVRLRQEC
jgi:hypothetical protein